MRARKDHGSKKAAKGERIGRQAFAAISAVEGIRLTSEMKQHAAEFDRRGLTTAERVREIIAIHRKG
jgi:hypothetical protein